MLKVSPDNRTWHEYQHMYFGALRATLWPSALIAASVGGGSPADYCPLLEKPRQYHAKSDSAKAFALNVARKAMASKK